MAFTIQEQIDDCTQRLDKLEKLLGEFLGVSNTVHENMMTQFGQFLEEQREEILRTREEILREQKDIRDRRVRAKTQFFSE